MLPSYLLAKAMNKMTWTVVVKLSSIHLDRRLRMFIVLILILNVDVDAGVVFWDGLACWNSFFQIIELHF